MLEIQADNLAVGNRITCDGVNLKILAVAVQSNGFVKLTMANGVTIPLPRTAIIEVVSAEIMAEDMQEGDYILLAGGAMTGLVLSLSFDEEGVFVLYRAHGMMRYNLADVLEKVT